jgi:hypothetical protein
VTLSRGRRLRVSRLGVGSLGPQHPGPEDGEDECQGTRVKGRGVWAPLYGLVHRLQQRILPGASLPRVVVVVVVVGGVAAPLDVTVPDEVVHVDAEGHHTTEAGTQRQTRLQCNRANEIVHVSHYPTFRDPLQPLFSLYFFFFTINFFFFFLFLHIQTGILITIA